MTYQKTQKGLSNFSYIGLSHFVMVTITIPTQALEENLKRCHQEQQ